MAGVTKILHGDFRLFSQSPAFCNRDTGELYINTPIFDQYNKNEKFFFLLHEMGHLELNTSDEMLADKFASDIYLQKGYPLTDSIKAMTQVLKFKKHQDYERLINQFNRDAIYDFQVNNNQKTKNMKLPSQNYDAFNADDVTNLGQDIKDIGQAAGIFIPGAKTTDTTKQPDTTNTNTPEKANTTTKSNTTLYIGISVLVIIILTTLIIYFKKTK